MNFTTFLLCLSAFLASVTASISDTDDWHWKHSDLPGFGITLLRAVATSLYISVRCDGPCPNITWEYASFRDTVNVQHVDRINDMVYALKQLLPETEYHIKATKGLMSVYLKAVTCPEGILPLKKLRLHDSGPGWLDIHWESPKKECKSDMEYVTRYRVSRNQGEETFDGYKYHTYGAYPIDDNGTLAFGPSHPCDDWPKEFCLLLTENVKAGRNHTVEVQARRLWGGPQDVSPAQALVALAGLQPTGRRGALGLLPECRPWAWAAAGAALCSVAIVLTMLISAVVASFHKAEKLEKEMNAAQEDTESEDYI